MEGRIDVYVLQNPSTRDPVSVYASLRDMILGWKDCCRPSLLKHIKEELQKPETFEEDPDTKSQMLRLLDGESFEDDLIDFDAFLDELDHTSNYHVCTLDLTRKKLKK